MECGPWIFMYFVDVNVTLFEVFVPENFTQLPFLRMMSTLQEKEISGLTFRQTMATKSTCVIYQAFVLIFVIPEIPWQILTTDIPTFLRRLLCRIWCWVKAIDSNWSYSWFLLTVSLTMYIESKLFSRYSKDCLECCTHCFTPTCPTYLNFYKICKSYKNIYR